VAEPSCSLIIFDCDGVLVDSEVLACQSHFDELQRIGHPISYAEFCRRAIGTSAKDNLAMLAGIWGRPMPDDYLDRVRATTRRRFETELRPIDGIAALLGRIAVPVCVASSSAPERLSQSLGLTGLMPRFEGRVFSAVEVRNGKPAPDLFLHAATRMGHAPERCLVVEDSEPGIRAAKAAGMTAIGFLGGSHCEPDHAERLKDAGADYVANNATALTQLLVEAKVLN
jgi:HAD superfamily hydrolase (TIGR01509 family)